MELDIVNNINNNPKEETNNISKFITELEQEINKKENSIKMEKNSNLSIPNNIAKNNKMTTENRKKLFLKEKLCLFDIYDKDKRAGELYYISSNGANNDFYVFKVNDEIRDTTFKIMKKSELPDNAQVGEIYRKKEDNFSLNKEETKTLEKEMKKVAPNILNEQKKEGEYKKEFTKNDLTIGTGYEGEYFEYPLDEFERLGKEAGLPESMINNFLKDDLSKIFEDIAKQLSKKDTIYALMPHKKMCKISNGEAEKTNLGKNINTWDAKGKVFKEQSGKLVEDKKATKKFQKNALEKIKEEVTPKYNNICNDYKKEGHIYEVNKFLDENYIPTITIRDISENRYLNLEDLAFIKNKFDGEGLYTVKNGEYFRINENKKIPKNNTVDREKEDEKNISSILAKKYNKSKKNIEEELKNFMIDKSKEEGVVVYTGYDKRKDEYYREYYMEGTFNQREIISKKTAQNMEVGTFVTMGEDEFGNYSGFFDAYNLREEFEKKIKS